MVRISSFVVFHVTLLKPLRKKYLRNCRNNPLCITLTNVFFTKYRGRASNLFYPQMSLKSSISQMIFQCSSDGDDEKNTHPNKEMF